MLVLPAESASHLRVRCARLVSSRPVFSSCRKQDAYRKLAMQVHPDTEGSQGGADRERFELIKAAYEVLSDPGKRSTYDQVCVLCGCASPLAFTALASWPMDRRQSLRA